MTTLALVGGQYGSEGKGVIAAGLAHTFRAAVRTGGPNAGHSFYHGDELFKMRSLPCAWVNPSCQLFIGAGAVIDPTLLVEEVTRADRIVFVDPQATVIRPSHHAAEQMNGLRDRIGSTTEGVGAARVDKIRREGAATLAVTHDFGSERVVIDERVADRLADIRESGGSVFLEGTQGAGLSLHHGRYPYVTSNDTNAAQLAADAGLPPTAVEHTHLVVRTYPIRVAGNSGPTGGAELDWDWFIERGVVEKPERTTVTNNVRRIFEFNDEDLRRAILLNDPCGIWVTFGDYVVRGLNDAADIDEVMDSPMGDWLRQHIFQTGVRLMGVGVGGPRWRVVETLDSCHRQTPGHHPLTWPLGAAVEVPF